MNIKEDIRIFMPGYSPADNFLDKKEPYISIATMSRFSNYDPTMYCLDGCAHRAWLHTFSSSGQENSQFIESFKDSPKLIERLEKRGFTSFK